MIARYAIERWARVPVEVEVASEFRYRDPVLPEGTLVIGITQSGETADTLAAMRLAAAEGATVIAVTNVDGSQATRDADATLLTRAGIEIGVAATKTFVAQVAALYLLGLKLASVRATLAHEELVAPVRRAAAHAAAHRPGRAAQRAAGGVARRAAREVRAVHVPRPRHRRRRSRWRAR